LTIPDIEQIPTEGLPLTIENTDFTDFNGITIPVRAEGGILYPAKGDMNSDGELKMNDVILLLRIVLHIDQPTPLQEIIGDMNLDGELKMNDVILLLRIVLHID